MRSYRNLMESLPSKTVVFAFGRFNPPTTGHQLLVKFVAKVAQQNRADHVIYASRTQDAKKNPLNIARKLHYLNLMFPGINFKGADDAVRTFVEAAKELNKRYKNIIMVAGSDRVQNYKDVLDKYNGVEFHFDSIQVVSCGERDPDADDASGMSASKMRAAASKGDFATFRKGLPTNVRDIDARRLMNDVRTGLGLDVIKEQVVVNRDTLREQYFKGEIFNVGDVVESLVGEKFSIVKRGTNHLLVKDEQDNLHSKWLHEVVQAVPHD